MLSHRRNITLVVKVKMYDNDLSLKAPIMIAADDI